MNPISILFTLNHFSELTGSELCTYELARELVRRGHAVTVCASMRTDSVLFVKAREAGIGLIGNTAWGDVIVKPDIVHAAQPAPTVWAIRTFKNCPIISHIHGFFSHERPIQSDSIALYLAALPEIRERCTSHWKLPEEKVHLLWNGFDTERFHPMPQPSSHVQNHILYVGTIDELRIQSMADMAMRAKETEGWLHIVGKARITHWRDHMPKEAPVTHREPTWDMEGFIRMADEVAGLWLGRTIIEGWLCGRKAHCYGFDEFGHTTWYEVREPPADLSRFDIRNVVDVLEGIYERALGGRHDVGSAIG